MFQLPLMRGTAAAAIVLATIAGCADTADKNQPEEMLNVPREHAEKGPHGGMLIELGGNHEFHAELLHNEKTGVIAVYLLDGSAANPVAISDRQITINVRLPEGGQQFALEANPDKGDPSGVSSRFVSRDPKLGEALHHKQAQSQLVLTIDGKPFRGTIEHRHEHDHGHGHDHDHDHDHNHEKPKQPAAPAGSPS
jgi:hypothetical protein